MKLAWCVVAIVAVVAAVASLGCGKGEKQKTSATTATGDVPLPEWAPENPSPEFLRAARVLKPVPQEDNMTSNMTPGPTAAVQAHIRSILFPAAYEFFGTLSDDEIGAFLARRELTVPVRSLTDAQLQALDAWFDAYQQAHEGGPPESRDCRVVLYKLGASEDLANVRVGFGAHDHTVGVCFRIGDPEKGPRIFYDFARL
jgi:hypothetical protein